jgi:1-acyl-sn-glycerol-3-phosphate acyltransferase
MSSAGTAVKRVLGKTFLAATGWKVKGTPPHPDQTCIFVGAPHTSFWDTALMLTTVWQCNLQAKFLIKQEITNNPFGSLLTLVGAIPVNRENPGPLIERLTAAAASDGGFQLVLTPEGTRKHVDYWKSGFYRFAWSAGIPLALVSPDKPTMSITFGPIFPVTGDVSADMDRVREFFADKHGVTPIRRSIPRLRAEDDTKSLEALLDTAADSA